MPLSCSQRGGLGEGLTHGDSNSVCPVHYIFIPPAQHRARHTADAQDVEMNEEIRTECRGQGFISKTSSHLRMHWEPKTKASHFTSKDSLTHPIHRITSRSSPVGLCFPPKPVSFSKPLFSLPNTHPKYFQKLAIPLWPAPG